MRRVRTGCESRCPTGVPIGRVVASLLAKAGTGV